LRNDYQEEIMGGRSMLQAGPALKVTIHLNQDTGSTRGFLYEDILRFLKDQEIEGATALRAHAGFGMHHKLHRGDTGDVTGEHLPMILYFVDEVEKVQRILPTLLAMVTDGLVEAHLTEVLKNITTPEKVLS
jgi:PII-like signaling protein